MSRSPAAWLLLALWVAGLVGVGAVVQRQLSIVSDLRLFLPAPATAEQRAEIVRYLARHRGPQ